MRLATAALSVSLLLPAATAFAVDLPAVLARVRQQIETADYRAVGRLVSIDETGKRSSYAITIKARWFPGVLRALIDIVPPSGIASHDRMRILFEMRPNGPDSIRIAHPGAGIINLPYEKWDQNVFGGVFNYEDFLEPQYYWQNQTLLRPSRFGVRDCEVLKSAPGAADRTRYAEVQTWLDHTILYPVYAEKTLKGQATVKQFTYIGLRQTGGVWSASQVEAKIRGRAGSTLLIVERGTTKANLSLKDFSPEQIGRFEGQP